MSGTLSELYLHGEELSGEKRTANISGYCLPCILCVSALQMEGKMLKCDGDSKGIFPLNSETTF